MQVDEDDVIFRREPKGRSSIELVVILAVGITLGTLISNGIQFLVVTTYAEYKLEQAARKMQTEAAQRQERMQQRELQIRQAELNQQQAQRRERVLTSDECVFWTEQNQRNPSQKTIDGVNRSCAY